MIAALLVFALATLFQVYLVGIRIELALVIALAVSLAFVQLRPAWARIRAELRPPRVRGLAPRPEEWSSLGRWAAWPLAVFVVVFCSASLLVTPPDGAALVGLLVALAFVAGRALAGLAHLEDLFPLFAAIVGVALSAMVLHVSPVPALVAVTLAVVLFAATWLHEFILLMRQPDDAFPGRFDKLVWGVLLVLLPPLGLLAFHRFRRLQWAEERKPAPIRALHELT